jgi:hypothetical protein
MTLGLAFALYRCPRHLKLPAPMRIKLLVFVGVHENRLRACCHWCYCAASLGPTKGPRPCPKPTAWRSTSHTRQQPAVVVLERDAQAACAAFARLRLGLRWVLEVCASVRPLFKVLPNLWPSQLRQYLKSAGAPQRERIRSSPLAFRPA